MKKTTSAKIFSNDYIGCFGDYKTEEMICKKWCAIKVRCIIEHDQRVLLDIMKELVDSSSEMVRLQ